MLPAEIRINRSDRQQFIMQQNIIQTFYLTCIFYLSHAVYLSPPVISLFRNKWISLHFCRLSLMEIRSRTSSLHQFVWQSNVEFLCNQLLLRSWKVLIVNTHWPWSTVEKILIVFKPKSWKTFFIRCINLLTITRSVFHIETSRMKTIELSLGRFFFLASAPWSGQKFLVVKL